MRASDAGVKPQVGRGDNAVSRTRLRLVKGRHRDPRTGLIDGGNGSSSRKRRRAKPWRHQTSFRPQRDHLHRWGREGERHLGARPTIAPKTRSLVARWVASSRCSAGSLDCWSESRPRSPSSPGKRGRVHVARNVHRLRFRGRTTRNRSGAHLARGAQAPPPCLRRLAALAAVATP